jgi:riboflavin synthase
MFTGLVEALGKVIKIEKGESSAIFTIDGGSLISQVKQGDSVAVNGVCLTATSVTPTTFTADVMVQTLSLTSLSQLGVQSPVNLELATVVDGRIGGHIVQGHVDGVAKVISLTPGDKWARFDIEIPEALGKYIVNQGSIAVDGVSLTVGEINDSKNVVTLWLIPETLERTNLSSKKSGDLVNIEVDIFAKYVERIMLKSKGGADE